MALHKIGNMKIILGKEGFGLKVGDKKLFHFGKGSAGSSEGYAEYPDDSDYAYENQDGYYPEDEAGYDEGYDNYDGYEDQPQDGYYDDRQDDGYYADGEEGYYPEDGYGRAGGIMDYIESNMWVLIALLIVLPPLGIYLLWRLNRFEFPVRVGVSVASAVWFIVALILIFSGIAGGGDDPSKLPEMTLTTMAPTATPTVVPVATPAATIAGTLEPDVTPGPTPLGGGVHVGDETAPVGDGEGELTNVYSPQTGLYYHSVDNCSKIDAGVQLTLVTRQAAVNRNQAPCPLCCGGEVFYATKDGRWYHTDRLCKGMNGAMEYSKEAAIKEGKTACPTCAGGDTGDNADGDKTKKTKAQKYVEKITNDRSGIEVYWTKNGTWFHTDENCKGMKDAQKTTLLKALQAGKTGCSTCFKDANKLVYCTSGGKSYHLDKNCQNMKNASQVTLAAAAVLGKSKCTICVTEEFYNEPTPAPETEIPKGDGSTAYVYATENGRYYHTNSTCTDMKNAQKVTLQSMIKAGRPACPTCCSSANQTVYVSKNGKYYHSYATCNGMTKAQEGTLAQALAYGYKACYDCWSGSKPIDNDKKNDDKKNDDKKNDDGNDGYSDVYIYASENGKYFHTKKNCSKADSDVSKVLLELAIDDGKTACPSCASEADDTVYAKKGQKYYHKVKNCQNISGMTAGTLAQALIHGYDACPVCYKDKEDKDTKKYTPGKSGINVYASASGKYYHTVKSCTSAKGSLVKVTLEAALNNNKAACTVCAASARRTVYAHKSGKYYHYSSSCAGSSATSGRLDEALAMGFKACPNCVTGDNDDDKEKDKFTPGKSGIKVYAVSSGKYFHTQDSCGSMKNGTKITLEDALNYGLKACPNCAAAAAKKVYAAEGSGTYHFDQKCAGAKAESGTRAEALALGMKACKKCVDTEDPDMPDPEDPGDDDDRTAPKDTRVYIDLSGKTNEFLYHTKSSCSECGMTGGTAVTLKYALDQGFADCGYCKPPLSIAK